MSAGAATTPVSQAAETFGWDTVFAIRVDDANTAIRNAKSSPTSFSAPGTDSLSGIQFTASGSFGDWQICLGGSGGLIHMQTPIPSLTVATAANRFSFQNGAAVIEVQLEFIPQANQPAEPKQGTLHDLKVKSTGGTPDQPVVSVISLSFPDPNFSDLQADVQSALGEWFNAHLGDFQHVFSTVNLNRVADTGQFQWLMPTYTSYAYIDGPTQDDSRLGVLCMTTNASPDGLALELSPNAIPSGQRAGFLISQQRFLMELLLPSMPLVFKGSTVADYSLSTNQRSLTLNNPVQLDPITQNGKTYTPTLKSLTITANGQTLTIDSVTETEVSWEIWSYCHTTYDYDIVLMTKSDGTQTLNYQQTGTPVKENWTQKGEGIEITEIIAGIIAALVTIIVGVLTGGAGFIIAGLIVGILMGVGVEVPNIISTIGTDDAPGMQMLVFNSTDPIRWSDSANFDLTSAGLNQSLQLGGVPNFSS